MPASTPPTGDSAHRAADIIRGGFEELQERFRAITRRAVERFEQRDWDGLRRDTSHRLALHARAVAETLESLREELGDVIDDRPFWATLKEEYVEEILGHDEFELAQTFFNSLTRKLFSHVGIDPAIDFLVQDFPLPYKGWELASARTYATGSLRAALVRRALTDADFRVPFVALETSAERAAEAVRRALVSTFGDEQLVALEFLRPIFVRNKAAYLVGRVRRADARVQPVVLAILNGEQGLELDAVLLEESDISILFSFARWYFHADVASPRTVIGFLHSILPRKRVSELYISLGYNKHGKTEFYGDLASTIATTDERFVIAPGQPGMVMSVFTLPSFEFVFKVIKDRFPPPKRTTPAEVQRKYRQVHLHDRVGRLIDFQEFEYLQFSAERFDEQLLEELLSDASKTVSLEDGAVTLRHLYVGRRVTPLDLFLEANSERRRVAAAIDLGRAIKELAAANIFPGDMLPKNFGVTRHGRVVFYDYDELARLSEINFRRLPEPQTPEQEMADEPWFGVGKNDVFPEELERFLGLKGAAREAFNEHHGDLFTERFWSQTQSRVEAGEVIDFFPYAQGSRLADVGGSGSEQ